MKYYQSPRWTNELLDCSMPMTFDTYNKCSYNCLYCFSYFQKSHTKSDTKSEKHLDYQAGELTWANPERIKKLFKGEIKRSQFNDFIKQKKVMQWGGLADQFDMYEKQKGITLEIMKFFDEIKYPLSFSTKAVWWTKDKRYMDLVKRNPLWHFKFSIINLDAEKASRMEERCPSPQERIEAIKRVSNLGNHVTLRLRPFIIGYSDKNNEHLELIKLCKEAGADSISTEFFCLEQRADHWLKDRYKQMSKIIGMRILEFYRANSIKRGYLRLNYQIKKKYIKEMKELCDKIGMRFYVSDAHHKEKCANGSCCGLPCSFNYSRGQLTEAIVIAREKGEVRFKDIEPHIQHFKKIQWQKAEGLNTKTNEARLKAGELTLFEYIRNNWNSPNKPNSPYKYFQGILIPSGLDEDGNIIYKFNYKKAKL